MRCELTLLSLVALAQTAGCGGIWVGPPPAKVAPSIPSRVNPDPQFLRSLAVTLGHITAQPDADGETSSSGESDWALEWQQGFARTLAARVNLVPSGGTMLAIDVRRFRGSSYVCDASLFPPSGPGWKKRYLVDAHSDWPDSEAGSDLIVADLLQDPEFLAALQGRPLPLGTGVYLPAPPH